MDLIKELEKICEKKGLKIPKPKSEKDFTVKGCGMRRGEKALIYRIPSNSDRPFYEKGVTFSEFQKAYDILQKAGKFTKKWFSEKLWACDKEGSCNFTTIGGIFELLNIAKYSERGLYIKI